MLDKKTFVLAVAVSWVLTLVTVLLVSNFFPNLTQAFTQQSVSLHSVKVVNLEKNEVMTLQDMEGSYLINLNFTWSPSNPQKNAIFGVVLSFEYKIDASVQISSLMGYQINILDFEDGRSIMYNSTGEWELVSLQVTPKRDASVEWITPNQNEHPIKLRVSSIGQSQVYIRNVNLMLLVIDG